jgi:hypothetical protein
MVRLQKPVVWWLQTKTTYRHSSYDVHKKNLPFSHSLTTSTCFLVDFFVDAAAEIPPGDLK